MNFARDLKFAARLLRRSPGFTLVAVLVLALGIGANTAIFSLVDAVLLQPLPFPHPQQLVQMYETEAAPGNFPLSGPDFPDWKTQSRLFADMTLYNYPRSLNLSGSGQPDRLLAVPVEANFFQLLGVRAALGRTFAPGEDQPGKNHVVVLSHNLWQSRFAGNPAVVGHALTLDGDAYTVIGVAPASFRLQPTVNLWTGLDLSPAAVGQRGNHSYSAIGRLRPGVTLAAAQAEMNAIAARLARQYPGSNSDTGVHLFALRDRLVRAPQRAALFTLLAVVGFVLLIACANLANLLLARALGRQKEMAIRLALGASRAQLVRQLLTESVLLALIGAALGSLLAWLGVRVVTGLAAFSLPQFNAIRVNPAVLAFTAVLAVGCGILFGLAPALQMARPQLQAELGGAGRLAGGSRRWLGDGLIVAEIALSLVLVAAAGLFIQSFLRLRSSQMGVNPDHLLTAAITLPDSGYSTAEQRAGFTRTFLQRVRALPGVTAAAGASELPLEGGSNGYISLRRAPATTASALVEWTHISDGYFAAMQIPILRGRAYSASDGELWARAEAALGGSASPTPAEINRFSLPVVVNQSFARHFFPGQNALGQQFRQGSEGPWLTIQGVARDVAIFSLGETDPMAQAYFPTSDFSDVYLVVRSATPPAALASSLRRTLAGLDAALPLYDIRTMNQVASDSISGQALQQWLIAGFALLALLLAVAGIYGVMAYQVAARTRELGVRLALGATPGALLRLVMAGGMRLSLVGIALGLAGAIAAGRVLASQLFQVRATDPVTLAAAATILLLASALACYIPARRAAAADPIAALASS